MLIRCPCYCHFLLFPEFSLFSPDTADQALKEDANKKAFDKFAENMRHAPEVKADGGASKRYMSECTQCKSSRDGILYSHNDTNSQVIIRKALIGTHSH